MASNTENSSSYPSFIKFGTSGMVIDSFVEIREKLINHFKSIYGEDIDVSTATADGVYVNSVALILNNTLQSLQEFLNQMNVNYAVGGYLDTVCALTNIVRKKASNSIAKLTLTLNNASNVTTIAEQTFVDEQNQVWEPMTATIPSGTVRHIIPLDDTFKSWEIILQAKETGPLEIKEGTTLTAIDASFQSNISDQDIEMVEMGRNTETDAELRSRRMRSLANNSVSSKEGIEAALLSIPSVRDAAINIYVNGGSTVIVPIIRSDSSVPSDTLKNLIANVLYIYGTLGVEFSNENSPASNDEGKVEQNIGLDNVGNALTEKFYLICADDEKCKRIKPTIYYMLTDNGYAGSSSSIDASLTTNIENVIKTYFDNLMIGDDVNMYQLGALINAQIPIINGIQSAYVSSLSMKVEYNGTVDPTSYITTFSQKTFMSSLSLANYKTTYGIPRINPPAEEETEENNN